MNAIVPHTQPVSDLERMAKAFALSKLFGVQNVEQALALMLVAQAEGRHPASAAQDYSIIQGRPSKKADAMLRDFLAAGGKVEWHALADDKADATFSHPSGGSARIDWTLDRAKKAGLANNAMYTKYPRQMLRSRVVSEGVRTVCPGATSGMYVPEEVQDIVEDQAAKPVPANVPAIEAEFTEGPPPSARKSAAQCKRDGDDVKIKAEIAGLDRDGIKDWRVNFDSYTAHVPLSWSDSIHDMLEARLIELDGEDAVREEEAELSAAFRDSVGSTGIASVAGSVTPGLAAA